MKSRSIDYETLSPEEVEALPKRVKGALGGTVGIAGEWMVVHSEWPVSSVVERFNRLGEFIAEHTWPRVSTNILEEVTWRLASERPSAENDIVLDNLVARTQYLDRTPLLSAGEIHDLSGLASRNRSEPASRWQKEGKTFGVRIGRPYFYPAFQFLDGRPRDGLTDILAALPSEMTAWQKAFWFASGNGWLDGDKPEERLDDVNSVVNAARQLSNTAHG